MLDIDASFCFSNWIPCGAALLTAPAATAWTVRLRWLKLERPLALIGSVPLLAIFMVLAVIELIADKLWQTPNRTAPAGLTARVLMGTLTGACGAAAKLGMKRTTLQSRMRKLGIVRTN